MDQGTQTLPDLSDTSAKDDDVFVAKFQLMSQQRIDETQVFKELEQNTIDLCQAAIDRHGLVMGDIPYEKLLGAIMQPRH
ncbi:hypothetical protein ColTof4_09712 [Colletotrichum tofieldiae]|nr:hypothetical protein ColTof3_05066 [Colletotrichum tofieldiae]GKT77289.1 hypothetical protein ColTof4_09712 [Colletotrichum tofieldiae]GKT86317.1 hypothetical protein Ct61P_04167 [Colletotrichum tofieldiae]